ncbi:MAG: nucleoside hydrolase [Clostridiales bacterium]|nr:nucleoside hydrolase [Clostridiales bacterium]
MNRYPVIIDCDPGVDDAIAILLAKQLPMLDVKAITAVAGNVGLEHTYPNSHKILHVAEWDVPVYAGAEKPIVGEKITAASIHGADGLGGMDVPGAVIKPAPEALAWDVIYEEAKKAEGELVLIAVGPLTNVAVALAKYSELPKLIKRIVIMGGGATYGNTTPAAEFNIFADPEAAEMVFQSGIPVYMVGLDVTMQCFLTPEEVEEVGALGSKQAKFFRDVLQNVLAFSLSLGLPGVALHDPAAVLYAVEPELFSGEEAGVHVECKGKITRGKTVTDLYSDAQFEKNAYVVTGVDRTAFVKRVKELMAQY